MFNFNFLALALKINQSKFKSKLQLHIHPVSKWFLNEVCHKSNNERVELWLLQANVTFDVLIQRVLRKVLAYALCNGSNSFKKS